MTGKMTMQKAQPMSWRGEERNADMGMSGLDRLRIRVGQRYDILAEWWTFSGQASRVFRGNPQAPGGIDLEGFGTAPT